MEALRQAVMEKLQSQSEELDLHTMDYNASIDRESGELIHSLNSFTNASAYPSTTLGAINLIWKNVDSQKLSFNRYVQLGHLIDTAIHTLVYNASYGWIKWWEVSSYGGMIYPMGSSTVHTAGLTTKEIYNHSRWREFGIITEISDILDYIGDTQFYFFSDYGDNTKWARQKYLILNTLKVFINFGSLIHGSAYTARPNAMGSYRHEQSGTHNYFYTKSTSYTHPDEPDWNSEWEGGDGGWESSLDSAVQKAITNSNTPYYETDGSGLDNSSNVWYSSSNALTLNAFSRFSEHENDEEYSLEKSSGTNMAYTRAIRGALSTRHSYPVNVDTYAMRMVWRYRGRVVLDEHANTDEYNSDASFEGTKRYPPLDSWNPIGLPSNEEYLLQLLKSYRLEPNIDWQEALDDIIDINMSIPSLPSLPTYDVYEGTAKNGDFFLTYHWAYLHVMTPEYDFASE
jgi:hypothetical protein